MSDFERKIQQWREIDRIRRAIDERAKRRERFERAVEAVEQAMRTSAPEPNNTQGGGE